MRLVVRRVSDTYQFKGITLRIATITCKVQGHLSYVMWICGVYYDKKPLTASMLRAGDPLADDRFFRVGYLSRVCALPCSSWGHSLYLSGNDGRDLVLRKQ